MNPALSILAFALALLLTTPASGQDYLYPHVPIQNDSLRAVFEAAHGTPDGYNERAERLSGCTGTRDSTLLCTPESFDIYHPSEPPCDAEYANFDCMHGKHVLVAGHIRGGKLQGNYTVFYHTGHIKMRTAIDHGELNQPVYHYYDVEGGHRHGKSNETGQLRAVLHYSPAGLHRVKKLYDPRGKGLKKGSFKKGAGVLNLYAGGGRLVRAITFANGIPHGPYTLFDDEGRPLMRGHFHRGQPHGSWHEYDRHLRVISTSYYDNGRLLRTERR